MDSGFCDKKVNYSPVFSRLFMRKSIHHPEHPQRDAVPVAGFDVVQRQVAVRKIGNLREVLAVSKLSDVIFGTNWFGPIWTFLFS